MTQKKQGTKRRVGEQEMNLKIIGRGEGRGGKERGTERVFGLGEKDKSKRSVGGQK